MPQLAQAPKPELADPKTTATAERVDEKPKHENPARAPVIATEQSPNPETDIANTLEDSPAAAKLRKELWGKATLDPLSEQLRTNLEDKLSRGVATPRDLALLLSSIGDHKESKLAPELRSALIDLGKSNPEVLAAAATLFSERGELALPKDFVDSCLNTNSPQVAAALLKMFANREDVAIPTGVLEKALSSWSTVAEKGEPTLSDDLMKKSMYQHKKEASAFSDLMSKGNLGIAAKLFGDKLEDAFAIPFCKDSREAYGIAAAALEIYAKRKDTAVTAKTLEDVTKISARLDRQAGSTDPLRSFGFSGLSTERREFVTQALRATANSAPERYFKFVDTLQHTEPGAVLSRPRALLSSPALRSQYSYEQLIKDRRMAEVSELTSSASGPIDRQYAAVLVEKLIADPKNKLDRETLQDIALPTLNALSDIVQDAPNLWDRLRASPPEVMEAAVRATTASILNERRRFEVSDYTAFGPGMALTPICHVGKECAPGPVIELGRRFKMDIKPVVRGVEDPLRGEIRKQEALLAVRQAAGNPKQGQMLYFNAHGGPNHIWLANGEIGKEVDTDLHVPAAISYRELASSVIQAAPTKGSELDLSHLRMTFDTCISGDFARRFLDDLSQQAGEQGKKIVGYPMVIAAAQRGSVAFMSRLDRSSFLQVAIARLPEGGTGISGADLYKLDRLLNQLTASQDSTLGEQMGVQDISVFSPFPQQQSLTEDVVRRVEAEGLKISKEPKPRSLDDVDPQRRKAPTLISPLGKDSALEEGKQTQVPESRNEEPPKEAPPPLNPQRNFFNSEISSLVLPPAPRPERNG